MGMAKGFPLRRIVEDLAPVLDKAMVAAYDGLNEYIATYERDYANDRVFVTKIEPYTGHTTSRGVLGVITAKDELDAWRFAQRFLDENFM